MTIVIRIATIEHRNSDHITVQTDVGIVADSDPAAKYEETEAKMDGILEAIERIELLGVVQ